VTASSLLEYYHNTVTLPVNEHGARYEIAKCHCRCWFCPDCCSIMGYNLRARLVPVLETFNGLLMVTLTVDPDLFPDPKTAYLYTMDKRCISVTTQDLDRWDHLHTRRYFYVVEWQQHTEQAHYHVIYDAQFIPFDELLKSWSKHRPKDAGPKQGNRPAFGTVFCSKSHFEGGPIHAARYATKYLIKVPEQGFPVWVLEMGTDRRVRRYSTSRCLWGTISERSDNPKTSRSHAKKTYSEKLAGCGDSVNVFEMNEIIDAETGEIQIRRHWLGQLDTHASVIDKLFDPGKPERRRRSLLARSPAEVRQIITVASGKEADWKRRRSLKVGK